MAKSEDRVLGILTHIIAWFTSFIGPLIILLVSEDEFTKNNARSALNWQISVIIYSIVSAVFIFIIIGFFMLFALGIVNLIFCIVAAVKAGDGKIWKYPMSISFLKVKYK